MPKCACLTTPLLVRLALSCAIYQAFILVGLRRVCPPTPFPHPPGRHPSPLHFPSPPCFVSLAMKGLAASIRFEYCRIGETSK